MFPIYNLFYFTVIVSVSSISLITNNFSKPLSHHKIKYLVYGAKRGKEDESWGWGFDVDAGINHQHKSIACGLADSKLQKRTLLLPNVLGIDVGSSSGKGEAWIPPDTFIHFDKLKSRGYHITSSRHLPYSLFTNISWIPTNLHINRHHFKGEGRLNEISNQSSSSSEYVARALKPPSETCKIKCECCTFSICENAPKDSELYKRYFKLYENFLKGKFDPPQVTSAVERAQSLLGNYSSVHVRRGDKLAMKEKYPKLDQLTQPIFIIKKLLQLGVKLGSNVFIASDEKDSFFKELKVKFNVYTLNNLMNQDSKLANLLKTKSKYCISRLGHMDENALPSSSRQCPPFVTLTDYSLFLKAPGKVVDTYKDTPGVVYSLTSLNRNGVTHQNHYHY